MTKKQTKKQVQAKTKPKGSQNKSVSKSSKPKDSEKLALVVSDKPRSPDPFTMDGTSHSEISIMLNDKYSQQIIKRAKKAFNLSKLEKLQNREKEFLLEGRKQVWELWSCMESLTAHTTLFNVFFLIDIGKILDKVEGFLGKKSKYMKWLKKNFGHRHMRYFQHAKQLAQMGEFAKNNASLGKNRLLELDRIDLGDSFTLEEFVGRYPFEDTTADMDGTLFREHVDGIITYKRFEDAGIDFAEFDQAALVAAILHNSITVSRAKQINVWLEKEENEENKEETFDDLILNLMVFPYGESGPSPKRQSLTKFLAEVIDYSKDVQFENVDWINSQKNIISKKSIIKAHRFISTLAEKMGIDLDQTDEEPEDTSGEGESDENI